MSDALDLLRCSDCGEYYMPKTTVTGRVIPHCFEDKRIRGCMDNVQTVVGPRFFPAPGKPTRGSLVDQEV